MSSVHEQLSEQFSRWEKRGRGWHVFDEPVSPEPPFSPFALREPQRGRVIDDGRRHTVLSSFVQRLSSKLNTEPPAPPVIQNSDDEPEARVLVRDSLTELQITLPTDLEIHKNAFEQFLSNLFSCRDPIAFELLGIATGVRTQFVAHPDDAAHVLRQLQAHIPGAIFRSRESELESIWDARPGREILIVEFGLGREFMFPIAMGKFDAFVGLIGVLAELRPDELGLFQVIFEPVSQPWNEHIVRAVSNNDREPLFVNAPELLAAAQEKTAKALYAAIVRIAVKSEHYDRTFQIARNLASALRVFAHPQGNEFIPLLNTDYPPEAHEHDLLRRQSRRAGMLLNADELIGLVHLPSPAVRSTKLARQLAKTKRAPERCLTSSPLCLGKNEHAGLTTDVYLQTDQRLQHMHIIGASGTGKSTLLFNLVQQDIEQGNGLAVLDPHGDLVDRILGIIPEQRLDDVVLIDPSDENFFVGFNILTAHTDLEKNLLASDLVSIFQRLSTSWGEQMESVLRNAILAFLESDRGGTLADLRRFLIEPRYREEFLQTVRDPDIVYYWQKGFSQLTGNKSIGPVLTRLETFLAPKCLRYMVAQSANRLDFANILDNGKIFLAKLAQGQIGKENSFLLGSLFVAKFQQLAMARQAQRAETRRPFFLFVDEFQNFITPSMAEILTGARKYRLGLVLAHQELRQLERDRDVAGAVLSNPYTRVVFRVGDDDARKLASGFSFFEAADIQNLETGQALCRIEKSSSDFNLSVPLPADRDATEAEATRQEALTCSRKKYAVARAEVEATLRAQLKVVDAGPPTKQPRPEVIPPPSEAATTPKPADVPNVVIITKTEEQPDRRPVEPPVARDLGRGGAQHQAIQKRLKEAAEQVGFRAVIEKAVLDGAGSIDLVLERDSHAFACEIGITSTIDHEVENVIKCGKAGYKNIVVISNSDDRLAKLREAVQNSLGPERAASVSFHLPDGFIEHLRTVAARIPPPLPSEERRRGYTVKRSFVKLSDEEIKAREEQAIRLISESMKKKRNG